MGELLNEDSSASLVHTTLPISTAHTNRRNAAQEQRDRHAFCERRKEGQESKVQAQQAQVQGDDRDRLEGREERLDPAEDHRQHRGQVQHQERLCGEEDPRVDARQEDDQVVRRKVPFGHRKGEAVRTAGQRQEKEIFQEVQEEEICKEVLQETQEGLEEEEVQEEESKMRQEGKEEPQEPQGDQEEQKVPPSQEVEKIPRMRKKNPEKKKKKKKKKK